MKPHIEQIVERERVEIALGIRRHRSAFGAARHRARQMQPRRRIGAAWPAGDDEGAMPGVAEPYKTDAFDPDGDPMAAGNFDVMFMPNSSLQPNKLLTDPDSTP